MITLMLTLLLATVPERPHTAPATPPAKVSSEP
ncbi:hypothetical protein GobsT_31330 [Gemmata obscuriglobus]|nr:hypothetical protein GobsT_31330 [Gemmata obscuriglobus]VTS06249.1 unnamed protein product [Gemmata obscuriglobus UQM 2246]VTS08151.1 unnamed protein product [Gemmata obscuriglobus UQM 2246]